MEARAASPSMNTSKRWGAEFADLDNDFDDDLMVAFGPLVMPETWPTKSSPLLAWSLSTPNPMRCMSKTTRQFS